MTMFKATPTINTPSTLNRWRFANLSAAELLPILQHYLKSQDATSNWQLVWLNNDGHSVIGLLPKVSWTVYFNAHQDDSSQKPNPTIASYQIIKTCRNNSFSTSQYMSYTQWQDELIIYSNAEATASNLASTATADTTNPPRYYNGLIGFIGYDMAAHELSPTVNIPQAKQPCAILGHYDIYLSPIKDNNQTVWQLTMPLSKLSNNPAEQAIISQLKNYLQHLDDALNSEQTKNPVEGKTKLKTQTQPAPLMLEAKWQKSDYQQAFVQTQRYLQQGDCYQINLTQAWQGFLTNSDDNTTPKLLDYLPNLHANTNAPFAGYLEGIDFELLSCSPELFFTFTTNRQSNTRHVITKPIKGTMPRSTNPQLDLSLRQDLIDSDKDRSENVMIVDLLRNDLGKYAKTGSVKVPKLFAIESFSNVHHMVSTITAELQPNIHPLAVLFGSLPAGSITGAPKKRAVEIISELEAAPRGAYCGTLGYMNFDGSGQWNVLIRTLQAHRLADTDSQISLWAGGGITVASSCEDEYQECLDKVGNLLEVLQQSDK